MKVPAGIVIVGALVMLMVSACGSSDDAAPMGLPDDAQSEPVTKDTSTQDSSLAEVTPPSAADAHEAGSDSASVAADGNADAGNVTADGGDTGSLDMSVANADDGAADTSVGADASLDRDAGPLPSDAAPASDVLVLDANVPNSCQSSQDNCSGSNTLRRCVEAGLVDVACPLGCSAASLPHCLVPVPSDPVVAGDFNADGLVVINIGTNKTLNSDTGEISGLRTANSNPNNRETIAGISFHQVAIAGGNGAQAGVFAFGQLAIASGTTLFLTGNNAVALVSASDVVIDGVIDALGTCSGGAAGPGGGHGGTVASFATGQGHGAAGASNASDATSGGSGAGFAASGGNTQQIGLGATTLGGITYGTDSLTPLLGGSGGGRGGDTNSAAASTGGTGGGGGGAVQIVAMGSIFVGKTATGAGINIGGCGGKGASTPAGNNNAGAGGGGGSGGGLLLEAPVVQLDHAGALAANGGGGGGGATGNGVAAQSGASGGLSAMAAVGGLSVSASCGAGGQGGTALSLGGSTGGNGGTGGCTGGGGGAAGRIRINTTTGAAAFLASSFASPAASQGNLPAQ